MKDIEEKIKIIYCKIKDTSKNKNIDYSEKIKIAKDIINTVPTQILLSKKIVKIFSSIIYSNRSSFKITDSSNNNKFIKITKRNVCYIYKY